MSTSKKTKRTCKKGHQYYKSSDCPTCPVCEEQKRPTVGFLSQIPAPARRALEAKGIQTLEQLATYSESELLTLHGLGPGTMPKLKSALRQKKLRLQPKK